MKNKRKTEEGDRRKRQKRKKNVGEQIEKIR
jgi:hypothetical protein